MRSAISTSHDLNTPHLSHFLPPDASSSHSCIDRRLRSGAYVMLAPGHIHHPCTAKNTSLIIALPGDTAMGTENTREHEIYPVATTLVAFFQ
jgi:hypothetical protein